MTQTIEADIGFALLGPNDVRVPLMATLLYATADPYAVRIGFHVGGDEPNEWVIARETLAAGLKVSSGEGDIQIRPTSATLFGGGKERIIHIELAPTSGHAEFEAPIGPIEKFLRRTYQIVPEGTEGDHLNLEAGLTQLLQEKPEDPED